MLFAKFDAKVAFAGELLHKFNRASRLAVPRDATVRTELPALQVRAERFCTR